MTTSLFPTSSSCKGSEAVLFDKDGTLIDIHHYWALMIRMRAALLVERWPCITDTDDFLIQQLVDAMGVDLETNRIKPEGPVGVRSRQVIVEVATSILRNQTGQVTNAEVEAIFLNVDKITAQNPGSLFKVLPGVEDFLIALVEEGVVLGVVTTDITTRADLALKTLGLDRFFSAVVGADQVLASKPAPDLALTAIEMLDAKPKSTVVIGDHPVDVKMGHAAGCAQAIAVLTGLAERFHFADLDCTVVTDMTNLSVR